MDEEVDVRTTDTYKLGALAQCVRNYIITRSQNDLEIMARRADEALGISVIENAKFASRKASRERTQQNEQAKMEEGEEPK